MKIQEVEQELIGVVMFAQECLLAYGRKCVDGYYDEELEIEVDLEVSDSNNRLIKITELDDIIEFVESYGYEKVRQCGSHAIYKNNGGNITVIPVHDKTISKELAYGIQKQIYKTICC
jgi:predicted RNA binding protein YcfA (HicA-like mRNA interferase family)